MPNDAKLGLVVGIGLVIAVAVVFGRKEPSSTTNPAAVALPAEQATGAAGPAGRTANTATGTSAQPASNWNHGQPPYGLASEAQPLPGGRAP